MEARPSVNDKHVGSSVDSRLRKEGIFEEVSANAIERALARQDVAAIPDLGGNWHRRLV